MRLFTRRKARNENCLAQFTVAEFQAAAEQLDNGNQGPADDLCARAGAEHGRCAAMAVLRFTRDDNAEGAA